MSQKRRKTFGLLGTISEFKVHKEKTEVPNGPPEEHERHVIDNPPIDQQIDEGWE